MVSCTVPASLAWRPQCSPHPSQRPPRLTLQLTRADLQHRVAEPRQEGDALLLTLALVWLRQQLYDQRALRAHVRDHERADFAACVETEGME